FLSFPTRRSSDLIFFRYMMEDGKSCTLLASDHDLILLDELANVFKAYWSLVQLDAMFFGQRIDQVGGRYRLGHAILPTPSFHEIIEQQSDDVVRLEKRSVIVHDAKPVGIAVRGDSRSEEHTSELQSR